MWFSLLYDLGLLLITILSLPKIIYGMIFQKKYRKSLKARLGLSFSFPEKDKRDLIWIHAVSVGETKAIAPLVKRLKEKKPEAIFVVSSGTETGLQEAKTSIPCADDHFIFPLDFSWTMRKIMNRVQPDLVLLCETDFWYHFLHFAKKNGAKLGVVNGKISRKSTDRLKKCRWLSKRLFSLFDFLCVQDSTYFERFEQLGIPKEKLLITGNLKFDAEYPRLSQEELYQWQARLGLQGHEPVLVIGSTHNPEEEWFCESIKKLWQKWPKCKVMIAPRHPERFEEVFTLLSSLNIPFCRLTKIMQDSSPTKASVIVIDTVGMLRMCYQFATIAIVGGSFVDHVGGHNILEPCAYGVPVVFGPHMFSQPELTEQVLRYQSGIQNTLVRLESTLDHLLSHPELRNQMGKAGIKLMEENKGAVERSLDLILRIDENKPLHK